MSCKTAFIKQRYGTFEPELTDMLIESFTEIYDELKKGQFRNYGQFMLASQNKTLARKKQDKIIQLLNERFKTTVVKLVPTKTGNNLRLEVQIEPLADIYRQLIRDKKLAALEDMKDKETKPTPKKPSSSKFEENRRYFAEDEPYTMFPAKKTTETPEESPTAEEPNLFTQEENKLDMPISPELKDELQEIQKEGKRMEEQLKKNLDKEKAKMENEERLFTYGKQMEIVFPETEETVAEDELGELLFEMYPTTISTNIYSLMPSISEMEIKGIYDNYVNLMGRARKGKEMSYEMFKQLLNQYQVYKYKNTYIFGQWDAERAVFITRVNSSPSSKELLSEALPNLVQKGLDFISFVPIDVAKKYERSGYTLSNASFDYDFKGEQMAKFAAFSNPNVSLKLFNKFSQEVTGQELEAYNQEVPLMEKPVEIKAELIEKAGKDAAAIMETYLNQFGIVVKDISEMKENLGIDEMGMVDLLSKIVYLKNKADLPPMAGQMIAYMMQYNYYVKSIIDELIQTEAIQIPSKSFTMDINGRKEYDYKKLDKKPFFEYIGNLIAEDLQNKLSGEYNKSLVDKIKALIKTFFDYITKTEVSKINKNIGIITNNILQQNKKLITSSKFKPGAEGKPVFSVDIESALKKDKFGGAIIKVLSQEGFILTGSTALAEQGLILRPDENPLHDIDWVSPFSKEETLAKMFKVYPKAQKIRDIIQEDYVTDSYIIAPEGYDVTDLNIQTFNQKSIVQSYNVRDKSGNIKGTYRLVRNQFTNKSEEVVEGVEAKIIDFFSYQDYTQRNRFAPFVFQTQEGYSINLANWKDIFQAKLNFARYKDIWDYNRFLPNENKEYLMEKTWKENQQTLIKRFPDLTKEAFVSLTDQEIQILINC